MKIYYKNIMEQTITDKIIRNDISDPGGITGYKNPMLHDNLSKIIRWYKGRTTFESWKTNPDFTWQSRFHDHIRWNDESFHRISEYLINWSFVSHIGLWGLKKSIKASANWLIPWVQERKNSGACTDFTSVVSEGIVVRSIVFSGLFAYFFDRKKVRPVRPCFAHLVSPKAFSGGASGYARTKAKN